MAIVLVPKMTHEAVSQFATEPPFRDDAFVEKGFVALAVSVELEDPLDETRFTDTAQRLPENPELFFDKISHHGIAIVECAIEVEEHRAYHCSMRSTCE